MNSSGTTRAVRLVLGMAGSTLLGVVGIATPALAAQPAAATVYTMSAGRIGASVAAVLGLAGAIVGGLALARPASRIGTGAGRLGATVALAAGLIGVALGGLVAATAAGGVGTGNGLGGAYVALLVGLIGVVLGGLALARSRRPADGSPR